jgi:hypothetical protein
LDLAEKLGLVDQKIHNLNLKEWKLVELKSKEMGLSDDFCPVCLENFKDTPQIILNCCHVFHKVII